MLVNSGAEQVRTVHLSKGKAGAAVAQQTAPSAGSPKTSFNY